VVRSLARQAAACAIFMLFAEASAAACEQLQLDAQLEDRFAILSGRSFYRTPAEIVALEAARRACASEAPRWRLALRASSADYPRTAINDDGVNIDTIAGGLEEVVAPVTVDDVAQSISHLQLPDHPVAAAFLINYLLTPNRAQMAASMRGKLTMPEMAAAAQYLGYLASLGYDSAKRLTLDRPIISPERVDDAAAAQLFGTNLDLVAGDCSDIANAQGDLLQKLGAKNVVIATYSLITGLHSTVLAKDPKRQAYEEFNFGWRTSSSGREGPDLIQPAVPDNTWTNVGPAIYLNKPNGSTVAYVPTNAGKLYAEVAGMNVHEIEPLARTTSSLLGQQLELGHLSLQQFLARDSGGSYYAGFAATASWAQTTLFPGSVGFVVAERYLSTPLSVMDFYLQLEQWATTPELRLGRWVRARLDATLILLGSHALPFDNLDGNSWGFGAAVFWNHGAQMTFGGPGSRWFGRLRVDAQLVPGVTNVAGSTPTIFLNHVAVSGEARVSLGPVALSASTMVIEDYFGTRLAVGIGVDAARVGVHLEAIGRAVESSPTYKEGSLRRARAVAGFALHRTLTLSALVELQEADADPHWSLTGAFGGRF
jgi:hypothetical protein